MFSEIVPLLGSTVYTVVDFTISSPFLLYTTFGLVPTLTISLVGWIIEGSESLGIAVLNS